MKKKTFLSAVLVTALTVSTLFPLSAASVQAKASSDLHPLTLVPTSSNNGLIHYTLVDDNGNEVIPKAGKSVSSRKKAASLPSSYDARTQNNSITSIKDQGYTGSCWAFASVKAMESSSILNGLTKKEDTDFSENHLAWYSAYPVTDSSDPLYGDHLFAPTVYDGDLYDLGGSPILATFVLANWWGAANEEDAPFTANTKDEVDTMAAAMRNADDSLRLQSAVRLKESNSYNDSSLSDIKEAIMENGALTISYYMPSGGTDEYDETVYDKDGICSIYNTSRDADEANHCVTVVGWDDNFSTFANASEKKGAWLIANSYGESFGMDGYFWLSYYDTSICDIYSLEAESADTYDTNFQYDGMGWGVAYPDDEDIATENIFTNNEKTPQRLEGVGFYTCNDNQAYKVQVYRNATKASPASGTLIKECTVSGTAAKAGYHTVKLANPAAIAEGETFIVRVTFLTTNGTALAPLEGKTTPSMERYFGSKSGQSYICFTSIGSVNRTSSWIDTTEFPDNSSFLFWSRTTNLNNVCVKAFSNAFSEEEYDTLNENNITNNPVVDTSDNDSQTNDNAITIGDTDANTATENNTSQSSKAISKISVTPKKITMGKSEKVALSIKTTPASGKSSLTYNSSNKKVATVSRAGKITAKKKGTATITIKAPSGITAKVAVTVKKAPSYIKAKTKKKVLKKGQTTKIVTRLSKKSASYKLAFRSSNKKVATVTSSGKIKARKKGTAHIRITTFNKKKTYVTIKVK
ncbi:MAG: lectin like domain-containing protein [Butyribacter sp.]|nr:lectin like domain-containing protein [Butyribacter sp.]